MSSTATVAAAIVTTIAADADVAAATRTIKYHGGKFTEEELARYGHHAPAILVTWLGVGDSRFPQTSQLSGQWMMFIVTKYRDRHTDGQDIHDLLFRLLLHGNRWNDCAAVQRPTNVVSRNHYSPRFDKAGVEVISIAWSQIYELDEEDGSSLPDFLRLHTCWNPAGEVGEGVWGDPWGSEWGASCQAEELQEVRV